MQVRAEGTIGDDEVEGAWSTGATGSPAAVPDAPGEVEVERGTDETSLMVTWVAPEEANGAEITGYTVRWRKSSDPDVYDSANDADVSGVSTLTATIRKPRRWHGVHRAGAR